MLRVHLFVVNYPQPDLPTPCSRLHQATLAFEANFGRADRVSGDTYNLRWLARYPSSPGISTLTAGVVNTRGGVNGAQMRRTQD